MSTITYKCDQCKREITKVENILGLTVLSKCIITNGCRGTLYKLNRDPDNIRESFPAPVNELIDYYPRKTLYTHEQIVYSKQWNIPHNLSSSPSISVYEKINGAYVELSQDEYTVNIIDSNNSSIIFPVTKIGVVQCIARSSIPISPKLLTPIPNPVQASFEQYVVFAIPELITKSTNESQQLPFNTMDTVVRIEMETIKPNEAPIICFEDLDDSVAATAWLGWNRVLIRNRRHYNLKAKKLTDLRTFTNAASGDEVPDGTSVKILRIDYGDGVWRTIPSRGLFILLSVSPYASADKVRNKLIDVGEMIATEYPNFTFISNDIYTNLTNLENTYPDIKNAPGKTSISITASTPTIVEISPTPSPVASPTPTVTPTISITPSNDVTPTITPTVTPTISITPSNDVTPTITPTVTPTMTVTPNPTGTPGVTVTPTITSTLTVTPTITPTMTVTPNPSVTPTPSVTVTPNPTITPTISVTPTLTPTQSG